MNSHEIAVRAALRAGDDIDRLIGRLGSAQHPRGEVLTAYRNAERGLRDVYRRPGPSVTREAGEVMRELRRVLADVAAEILADAVGVGQTHARQQAGAQGLDIPMGIFAPGVDTAVMAAAWLATVDQQAAAVTALTVTGADEDEILGDDSRAGVLRPAPVIAEGSRWVANAVAAAMALYLAALLDRQGKGTGPAHEWYHQAVAALDERTTDCCLRVHGQTQALEKPFHLTGTPRYADYLDHPPFHWYCRTAEALIHRADLGDKLTQEMQEAAAAELAARAATGKRVEIHPAHARSRR